MVNIQTQFSQEINLSKYWFDDGNRDVKYQLQSMIIREINGHHTTILYRNQPVTNCYLNDGSSYVAIYELSNMNEANCAIGPNAPAEEMVNSDDHNTLQNEIISSTRYDGVEYGDHSGDISDYTNDSPSSSECIRLPKEADLSIHQNASDYISVVNLDDYTSVSSDENVSLVECPNDLIEIMASTTYLEAIEREFEEEFNLSDSFIIDKTNEELDDDGIQDSLIRTVNNLTNYETIIESNDASEYPQATSSESSFNYSDDSYESFAEKTDNATGMHLPPENPLDKLESIDENDKSKRPGRYVRAPISPKRRKRENPLDNETINNKKRNSSDIYLRAPKSPKRSRKNFK